MYISQLALFAILALCLAIFFYLYQRMARSVDQLTRSQRQISHLQNELSLANEKKEQADNVIQELKLDLATLENNHHHLQERWQEHMADSQRMEQQFELLASKVLDKKAQQIDRHQQENLNLLLNPLKERIKTFESRIDQNTKNDIERHASLKEQILHLASLNERMTNETANLTKALKGGNKVQGNWGELILESILSKSGLRKDQEYFVQASHTDENGKRLQPDMLIKTPDEKVYIIDAKVSLTAYEQYVNAADEATANTALKAHILSIKNHVDILTRKNYHDLYGVDSPDLVLMFIPIETAFAVAVREEQQIYQYAFDRQIVIVTPSTLLATLKTIDTLWKNDRQQKYALDIASEAGKMYDKFQSFTEDMLGIEQRISQLQNSYDAAMNKLTTGKGNLLSKADKIKSLGAKANKQISDKVKR